MCQKLPTNTELLLRRLKEMATSHDARLVMPEYPRFADQIQMVAEYPKLLLGGHDVHQELYNAYYAIEHFQRENNRMQETLDKIRSLV